MNNTCTQHAFHRSPSSGYRLFSSTMLAICFLLATAPGTAIAQGLSASLDVSPDPAGAALYGRFDLTWPGGSRSSLDIQRKATTTIDTIADLEGSLLAATETVLQATLDIWSLHLSGINLAVGVAYREDKLLERGNFEADATIQVYDNELSMVTLGPRVELSVRQPLGSIALLNASASAVPVFSYWYEQLITIKPSMSDAPGSSSQNRIGMPRLGASLSLCLANIIELGGTYGYTAMPFDLLGVEEGAFVLQTTDVVMHDYRLQAELLLGIIEGAKLRLGLTVENSWAVDKATGEPTTGSIPEPRLGMVLGISVR